MPYKVLQRTRRGLVDALEEVQDEVGVAIDDGDADVLVCVMLCTRVSS